MCDIPNNEKSDIINIKMLNLIASTIEQGIFSKKKDIMDLCLAMEYMVLDMDLQITPLFCQTIVNDQEHKKDFTIGIPTHMFIYGNIYKKQIEGFISRYYLGRYIINIKFAAI